MADQQGSSFKPQLPQGEPTPEAQAFHDGFEQGRKMGVKEGRMQERTDLLGVLEKIYMDPKVKRGSTDAQAILGVSRLLDEHFRKNPIGGDA